MPNLAPFRECLSEKGLKSTAQRELVVATLITIGLCVLAIVGVVASVRLANSRLGRAWLYVRHDEDAAEAMGIDRVRVKLAAYVVGAIYGSVGGAFFAAHLGAISPESF